MKKSFEISHFDKIYSLLELMVNTKIKLTKIENMIISLRLEGNSIETIEIKKLSGYFDSIIVRISAITGIKLPETNSFKEVLIKEMLSFLLNFGYENLTMEEIIFAFNLNAKGGLRYPSGTDIEPVALFGEHLSVDYVSKVLANYMAIRNLLDMKFINEISGF